MSDVYDEDGHVRLSLALYVMGALREEQSVEVDAHLDRCAECRLERRERQAVTLALGLLSVEEVEELSGTATEDGRPVSRDPGPETGGEQM